MNKAVGRLSLTCSAVIAAFIGIASASAARAQVSVEIRTVALTGDPAPDTGLTFSNLQPPLVTRSGQVGFNTTVAGNDSGIWVETVGTLGLVVRAGDPAPVPGLQDVTFSGVFWPVINEAQQMAFRGVLVGPDVDFSNDQSLWAKTGDTLSLIAREGDTPPDEVGNALPDLSFRPRFLAGLDGAGRVTFFSELLGENPDGTIVNEDNENDGGIWAEKAEPDGRLTLVLVAREGQTAPNTEGKLFCPINSSFGLSSTGKVAFLASLVEPEFPPVEPNQEPIHPCEVNPRILHGVWRWVEGDLALFLRTGDSAPDEEGLLLPGVTFSCCFSHLTLNRFDRAAFRGSLTGQGVDTTNNSGLWAESPQDILRLVARTGDPAPGTEAGVAFQYFYHILHSGSGDVALFASVVGDGVDLSNHQGIWAGDWDPDSLSHVMRLVARTGDPAPGTRRGVEFDAFDRISLNDSGHVAFRGRLRGPHPPSKSRFGLFAEDPFVGNLTLIAFTGNDIEVTPGDFRTVERLDLLLDAGTGENGRNSYLSDTGQIAFRATFTDGLQGIFVATFVEGDSSTGGGGGKGGGGKRPKR